MKCGQMRQTLSGENKVNVWRSVHSNEILLRFCIFSMENVWAMIKCGRIVHIVLTKHGELSTKHPHNPHKISVPLLYRSTDPSQRESHSTLGLTLSDDISMRPIPSTLSVPPAACFLLSFTLDGNLERIHKFQLPRLEAKNWKEVTLFHCQLVISILNEQPSSLAE